LNIRFQKKITIAKGVKLNVSKSGVSATVGKKGLSVNLGAKGVYLNAGLPGTGLSARQKILDPKKILSKTKSNTKSNKKLGVLGTLAAQKNLKKLLAEFTLAYTEDFKKIVILDHDGDIVEGRSDVAAVKGTNRYDELLEELQRERMEMLQAELDEFNAESDAIIHIYSYCCPLDPVEEEVETISDDSFEDINLDLETGEVEDDGSSHLDPSEEEDEAQGDDSFEVINLEPETREFEGDGFGIDSYEVEPSELAAQIEDAFGEWVSGIELPVEFDLQYSFIDKSSSFYIDLDLPEIEDLPQTKMEFTKAGNTRTSSKSQKQLKDDYAACVFGMAAFMANNALSITPQIKRAVVSGYTQRRNKVGEIEDEYVYSIQFDRNGYTQEALENKSAVEFCMSFKNRAKMTANMDLRVIAPYGSEDL